MEDAQIEKIFQNRKSIGKDISMNQINLRELKSERPKKRKIQTEPNSPLHFDVFNSNINNISIMNNSIVASKEHIPIKLYNRGNVVKGSNSRAFNKNKDKRL